MNTVEKYRKFVNISMVEKVQPVVIERANGATITDTEVSKDLRHAKVYVSVYGDEKQKEESLAVLQSAARYIRGEFGRRVFMKVIPEISFKLDTSAEHGARIFELLQQVKREEQS